MFQDPGQKLKNLAKFIFYVIIILHVIGALILCGVLKAEGYGITGLFFFLLLVELLIGALVGWLVSIGIYAFGELVEDAHATRQSVERLEDKYMRDHPNQVWINPEDR